MNFLKILLSLTTFISLNTFASEDMSMMHRPHDSCSYIHCPHTCGNTYGCEWVSSRHGGYCTESYNNYDYCADISCPNRCDNTDGCRWSNRKHRCVSDVHRR